jgi:hypothetical protein
MLTKLNSNNNGRLMMPGEGRKKLLRDRLEKLKEKQRGRSGKDVRKRN